MKTRLISFTGILSKKSVCRISSLALALAVFCTGSTAYANQHNELSVTYTAVDTIIVTGSNQTSQFNLPLVLTAFSASLINQNVVLNWTAGQEKQLSHFVIERSTNGRDYSEVAIVVTESNDNVKQQYQYKDAVKPQSSGILYYRLRLVDLQGRYQNSSVRIVKPGDMAAEKEINISVYPNPVSTALRITIPSDWQNKPVNYDVYNSKGQLVKHTSNSQSGQTEVVSMQELGAGLYVVKAYTESAIATKCVVKQ